MKGVKVDLDAVDMQFRSPLHWAAVLGLSEVMTLLLNYGANPTIPDAVGATALHYAVSIINILLVGLVLCTSGNIGKGGGKEGIFEYLCQDKGRGQFLADR